MDETKEDTMEEGGKWGAPDSGLRRSRSLGNNLDGTTLTYMMLGNATDSDGETFQALASSTGPEKSFCIMGSTGKISAGPWEPNSVTEALEDPHSDH